MDLSEKKTTLDDTASIYQKREEKTDKEKWKELKGFKAKWEHFKAYYLLKTFIGACIIAFVGYMAYEMFAPEPERLIYVAVLDTVLMNDVTEELQKGFEEYMSMDEDEQETVFDNSMNVSNTRDASSAEKFTVHAYVGDIDVLIAPESVIKQYAGNYILDISYQLPEDLRNVLEERFCYANTVEDGMVTEELLPYGIYITDWTERSPYSNEPIVLAVSGNTGRIENAEKFVRYLMERAEGAQSMKTE